MEGEHNEEQQMLKKEAEKSFRDTRPSVSHPAWSLTPCLSFLLLAACFWCPSSDLLLVMFLPSLPSSLLNHQCPLHYCPSATSASQQLANDRPWTTHLFAFSSLSGGQVGGLVSPCMTLNPDSELESNGQISCLALRLVRPNPAWPALCQSSARALPRRSPPNPLFERSPCPCRSPPLLATRQDFFRAAF